MAKSPCLPAWINRLACLHGSIALLAAGEVRLPYISEENHDEDPEMQVGVPEKQQ